ncbi:MAG: hypothetical protein E3J70_09285 [Candidatus Heimdallarchaeota archaeon]|nr:MAG: hypothetical protein E3J70_09285 [Candidatus Heimdallarchaeota archaeon]
MSDSLFYDLITPILFLPEVERQVIYYIISGVIGAVGIIGALSVYFLTKKKWMEYQADKSVEERTSASFKEKLNVRSNRILFAFFLFVIVFTVTALPYIISPDNLADIWIQIGLFGLLGLGTPFAVIVLIVIYRDELKEFGVFLSKEEPLLSWFNFGLIILGISIPFVCLALITLYRKQISKWKQLLFVVLLLGIIAMWFTLAIWATKA